MEPGNLLTALVWAVVPSAVLLTVIYSVDRYEKEPVRLLAIALLFGAVVAPLGAFLAQKLLDVPTSMAVHNLVPASRLNFTTPLVEEVARGVAVLLVFLIVRHDFDSLLDGLVYGAVVGVGFAMTTTFVAIVATPSLGGSQTPSLFAAAVASLNHVFYAGVIGLSLAAVRRAATGPVLAAAAGGTGVALGFHLLHDYLPDWVASSADAAQSSAFTALLADLPNLLGLAAIGVLLVWATGREGVIVGRELADEVQAGVVTREEYDVITNSLRRFTTLASTLFGRGDDAWRLRRRLYVLEVELAYRKHHRRTERAQPRGAVDEDEYRRRIAETRSRLESVLEVAR